MLDFCVGLDTEFSEVVEGSHLYFPKTKFDQVMITESCLGAISCSAVHTRWFFPKIKRISYSTQSVILKVISAVVRGWEWMMLSRMELGWWCCFTVLQAQGRLWWLMLWQTNSTRRYRLQEWREVALISPLHPISGTFDQLSFTWYNDSWW